jgi:hypothetical protein
VQIFQEAIDQEAIEMSSTMTLSFRIFPGGAPVPGTTSGVFQLMDGASQTLAAPLNIAGSGNPATYSFIFWAADFRVFPVQTSGGVPDPQQTVNFDAPGGQAFDATAWYVPDIPGGPPEVNAWAFSLNQDQTLPNSPFGSVSPASAQQGPNTVSTATGGQPVIITAAESIGGYGRFGSWLQFYGKGTVSGSVLTVPSGGESEAIAFYSIPVPDPCQEIRDQLDNLSRGDFNTAAEFERAFHYFVQQLKECEKKYGELP